MAICEISNGKLTVSVDSCGAEMRSLRRVDNEKEYLWCANPEYWPRTAPVLFPIVGGLKNGEYRYGGQTYEMVKHGFARDTEFKLLSHDEAEIWFVLEDDEKTREIYPFHFRLEIGYRLEDMKVKVLWRVDNPSEENIYFSIGGHPAFNCPIQEGEARDDYYVLFDTEECIRCTVIGADGLASDNSVIYELEEGRLPISDELFDKDAMILEHHQVKSISLLTPDKKPYIRTEFDMPVAAVWAPTGKNAPFICIEPWCGSGDHTNFKGTLEERKWGIKLESGKRFASGYDIIIVE